MTAVLSIGAQRHQLCKDWRREFRALNASQLNTVGATAQDMADWNARYEAVAELRRRIDDLDG